jgi:putative DNA primase/helicase
MELLLSRQTSNAKQFELCTLQGVRMLATSEVPAEQRLNEAMLKNLTGGEQIRARQPGAVPYSFEPSHTLWMAGNFKPIIAGQDHGTWRRISLIPFLVTIPSDKRRPLPEILDEFRQEASGILGWLIQGYRDFVTNGLQEPETVRAATEEYRADSNNFNAFTNDCCQLNKALSTTSKALFNAYIAWCGQESETPAFSTAKKLNDFLRLAGYAVEVGTGNRTVVRGIALSSPQPN